MDDSPKDPKIAGLPSIHTVSATRRPVMASRRTLLISFLAAAALAVITTQVVLLVAASKERSLYERAMQQTSIDSFKRILKRIDTGKDVEILGLKGELWRYPPGFWWRSASARKFFAGRTKILRYFLARYPRSAHADSVRSRIEAMTFEWFSAQNTVWGYQSFLERYPQGTHADSARSWLESARAWIECVVGQTPPAVRQAKSARVIVAQSYGRKEVECFVASISDFLVTNARFDNPMCEWRDASAVAEVPGVELPLREIAERHLKNAGIEIIGPGGDVADFTLSIRARGIAAAVDYNGAGYRYTGASLSGTLQFLVSQTTVHESTFSFHEDPSVHYKYSGPEPSRGEGPDVNPSSALFQGIVDGSRSSYKVALSKAFGDALGDEALLDLVLSGFEHENILLERIIDRCDYNPGGPSPRHPSSYWLKAIGGGGKALLEEAD